MSPCAACVAAFATGYAFLFAPRKLGWRGEAALVLRGCSDNALSFVLFNMLGIMPALLGCVAWPVLRNNEANVSVSGALLDCCAFLYGLWVGL